MRDTLRAGIEGIYRYRVAESKTVPRIYEEAPDFQRMPAVLATGYLVALAEWACIELGEGTHERHVIDAQRFEAKLAAKRERAGALR